LQVPRRKAKQGRTDEIWRNRAMDCGAIKPRRAEIIKTPAL
jgi:hypothetical protein